MNLSDTITGLLGRLLGLESAQTIEGYEPSLAAPWAQDAPAPRPEPPAPPPRVAEDPAPPPAAPEPSFEMKMWPPEEGEWLFEKRWVYCSFNLLVDKNADMLVELMDRV